MNRLIINELFTSDKYSIATGKPAYDIAPSFAPYYENAVVTALCGYGNNNGNGNRGLQRFKDDSLFSLRQE